MISGRASSARMAVTIRFLMVPPILRSRTYAPGSRLRTSAKTTVVTTMAAMAAHGRSEACISQISGPALSHTGLGAYHCGANSMFRYWAGRSSHRRRKPFHQ